MPARKPTKTTQKPTTKTRRAAPPARGTTLSSKKGSPRGKPAAAPAPSRPSLWRSISLDRKLDLLGIGMTLVGLLTLLSLLSQNRGWISGGWLAFLGQIFGWGMYLLPVGLIVLGVWLILRHFDRLPRLALERVVGLILLYLNLLAWLHYFNFPADRTANFDLAEQSLGGGYAGGSILALLNSSLGMGGTTIVLVAWLIVALALSFDISIQELFGWIPSLFARMQKALDARWPRKTAPTGQPTLGQDFTPLQMHPTTEHPPAGTLPAAQPLIPIINGRTREWVLPPVNEILEAGGEVSYDEELDKQRARMVEDTLASFGAPAKVIEINRGPTITQFGVEPGFIETRNGQMRVRVSKIAALADDLALALSAKRIRIQAPVPSKGYVGIEVPNEAISLVALRDVLESEAFRRLKSPLRFALGQDVAGNAVSADLSVMPHLLIAGATGSGKSVCVNALIC